MRSWSRDPRRAPRLLKSHSRAHALASTPSPGIQTCSIFLSSLSSFVVQPDPVFEFREKCGIVLCGSFSAKLHLSNILVSLSTCQLVNLSTYQLVNLSTCQLVNLSAKLPLFPCLDAQVCSQGKGQVLGSSVQPPEHFVFLPD